MQDWHSLWQLIQSPQGALVLFIGIALAMIILVPLGLRNQRRWQHQLQAATTAQRDQLEDLHQLQWRLEESEENHTELCQQLERKEALLQLNQNEKAEIERQLTAASTRLNSEREHFSEQMALLKQAETRLVDTFQRLAHEIFDSKNRRFQELSQQQLGQLLNPLQSQLQSFGQLVKESHERGRVQHAVMEKELKQLQQLNHQLNQEAHQLVQALRGDVKQMGNWGELKLERLLKLSGLQAGHEYELQLSIRDEHNGKLYRPDAVIRLPDGQSLIIDAKVSLEHFQQYLAADDEKQKSRALKAHLNSLRLHMKGLAQKEYHLLDKLQSPEFVFMFVPSEPAYLSALQADEQLLIEAHTLNIVLLSPSNLLATLRTVASLWRLWKRNENALDIARRAGLLYDKFVGFSENLKEIGQRLEQARLAYERGINQLSLGPGNLVRQAEQLRELGARTAKQIDMDWLQSNDTVQSADDQQESSKPNEQ